MSKSLKPVECKVFDSLSAAANKKGFAHMTLPGGELVTAKFQGHNGSIQYRINGCIRAALYVKAYMQS